jgi:hypothetical protein
MDKQTIIDFIQRIGKAISRYEWGQYPDAPCSKSTVAYTFGNWRAAMEAAGYKSVRSPDRPIKACLICGKATKRTYCSRACGLKDTARFVRRYQAKCMDCGQPISKAKKVKRCPSCCEKYLSQWRYKTKGDVIHLKNGVRRPSGISELARRMYLIKGMTCTQCGYPHHVQACHIKPVRDFPNSALLTEINAPENIALLCPNCHWELDHGLLLAGQVTSVQQLEPCYRTPVGIPASTGVQRFSGSERYRR